MNLDGALDDRKTQPGIWTTAPVAPPEAPKYQFAFSWRDAGTAILYRYGPRREDVDLDRSCCSSISNRILDQIAHRAEQHFRISLHPDGRRGRIEFNRLPLRECDWRHQADGIGTDRAEVSRIFRADRR